MNKELSVIIELIKNGKGGKRESQEIYKAVRELENRVKNGEFLKDFHADIEKEVERIEKELPILIESGRYVENIEIKVALEELLELDPTRKDAKFVKIAVKIAEIDKRNGGSSPNNARIAILKRTIYVLLKEKIEELINEKEKEDIARTKKIQEKIKESQR